jgi:hypothetical protein
MALELRLRDFLVAARKFLVAGQHAKGQIYSMKLHQIRILWTGKPNSGTCSSEAQIGRPGTRLENGTIPDEWRDKMNRTSFVYRVVVAIAVFCLGAISAQSQNVHCVRAGATGAGTGNNWTDAYTAIPAKLVRGDTYYIAAGSYGSHTFTVLSGTNYVYLKKATVADHGASTGWDDSYAGQAVASSSGAVWVIEMTYLSIDGVAGSGSSGYGIQLTTTSETQGDSPIQSYGASCSGLIVKYVEMACPSPGFTTNSCFDERTVVYAGVISTNILIQHCYLHGGLVGLTFTGDGLTTQNNIVEYCYLRSFGNREHSEAVQLASTKGVTLRYNRFEDLILPSTTYIEPQFNPSDLFVYGNVFRAVATNEGTANPSVLSMTSGEVISNCLIYNNTIYGLHGSAGGYQDTGIGADSAGNPSSGVVVRNNIWQNCVYDPGFAGVTTQDHNLLNTGGAAFVNAAAGDFHLARNTTVGVNLGSPYNIDPDGNIRATWSLGAYEYGTVNTNPVISVSSTNLNFGSVPTNTTSDLTFTVQNTGGGTLAGTATVSGPFSIVAGGTYSLSANQSQNVTVGFSPKAPGLFTNTVTFTGGGGMTKTLSGTGITNYPAPQVSAITQSGSDVDSGAPGIQVFAGSTEQYSGSASDPSGLPLSWQWIYTVNGGSEIVFQSGTGVVATVSFNYTTNTAGNTCVWKLRVRNGFATAESDLTVGVEATPVVGGGLAFPATSGTLTAPFVATNGYISQAINTDVNSGGQAVYSFTITNAGNYVVQASVNATSITGNSFYVNFDAQPQDPSMIWDINPVTSGFEQRLVSWRGNGAAEADQFVPEIFNLTAGMHQLIIVGREPGTLMQSVSILKLPPPPLNLHIVPSL